MEVKLRAKQSDEKLPFPMHSLPKALDSGKYSDRDPIKSSREYVKH